MVRVGWRGRWSSLRLGLVGEILFVKRMINKWSLGVWLGLWSSIGGDRRIN